MASILVSTGVYASDNTPKDNTVETTAIDSESITDDSEENMPTVINGVNCLGDVGTSKTRDVMYKD